MYCEEKEITILLSLYNQSPFWKDFFSSLDCQSNRDFCLNFRFDGLRNGEVAAYLASRSNFREYLPNSHKGIPATYWELLSQCSGSPYIMLADQDDVWHPEKIEETLAAMKKAEKEFGVDTPILVHSDLRVIDADGSERSPSLMKFQMTDPQKKELQDLIIQNNITGCTVMINRALFNIIKIPEFAICHDWYLGLIAAAFGKIVFIDKPLIDYRQHESNFYGAVSRKNLLGKFLKRQQMRQRLILTQKQAVAFLEQYRPHLEEKQIEILEAWSSLLTEKSYWKRLTKILRFKFRKNDWLRTFGMWWAI